MANQTVTLFVFIPGGESGEVAVVCLRPVVTEGDPVEVTASNKRPVATGGDPSAVAVQCARPSVAPVAPTKAAVRRVRPDGGEVPVAAGPPRHDGSDVKSPSVSPRISDTAPAPPGTSDIAFKTTKQNFAPCRRGEVLADGWRG
jgi:hypothetical protein